jgi:pyruvate dehydrogenase E2 component (dihydrolipoamide acetyltransferase)
VGEFLMPSLGADMEAGTLIEWLVKPGDTVERGDIVAVVGTDKADIDVEVFQSGVVESLLVDPGAKVPVGTPLASIATEAAGVTEEVPAERPEIALPAAPEAVTPAPPHIAVSSPLVRHRAHELGIDLTTVAGTGTGGTITREDVERAASPAPRRKVTPRAKKVAADLGLDLATIAGTGPEGAITEADVRAGGRGKAPLVTPEPTPAGVEPAVVEEVDRALAMRRAIGNLMARSKREIPHYYLTQDVDMTGALGWLDRENRQRDVTGRLIYAVLLMRAVALAAREAPEMNGYWVDDAFRAGDGVHLGVAVSLRGGGLIAPALHDADRKSLDELMAGLRDLVGRARTGRLRSSEMSDPTITVTNLGEQGVDSVLGVIYPPQVALVGFGRITERPWAEAGMVGARPIITVSLSADHRASDGHRGGIFLASIDRLLQEPEEL